MPNQPSKIARSEFASALAQVAHERGIDVDLIIESIKTALVAAFRKDYPQDFNAEWTYEVNIDPISGESKIFGAPIDENGQKTAPNKDVTPPGFGRIAAQTAKQVILQKIREAEKNATLSEYEKRLKTLVNGMVLRFDGPNIIVDVGKSEAVMPPQEKIPTENYHVNQRLVFFLEDIRETMRGREIIVSRAAKGLVEALFKREVPEVANGSVEIKGIAREAGSRTKIAVASNVAGVDPVGSCVGQKGVRVQAVINDLAGEKIDIIQFSDEADKFIANALSPAQGVEIKITSVKKLIAKAAVPEDQLSLAIGRDGQNVRLASKLTGYKIDVTGPSKKSSVSMPDEAVSDASELPVVASDDSSQSPASDSPTDDQLKKTKKGSKKKAEDKEAEGNQPQTSEIKPEEIPQVESPEEGKNPEGTQDQNSPSENSQPEPDA